MFMKLTAVLRKYVGLNAFEKVFFFRAFRYMVGLAILDQITKQAALWFLKSTPVLSLAPFFNLVHVENKGVSFGLFPAHSIGGFLFLVALTTGILIALLIWCARTPPSSLSVGLILVTGGALGNLLDRLIFGAVIDFLDFHWKGMHFPAFNLADAFITIGAAVVFYTEVFCSCEKKAPNTMSSL